MLCDFYDLYCNGYYFLDNLGLGYGLCALESWAELNQESISENTREDIRKEQISQFDSMRDGAIDEAQKVLSWLETGKIAIATVPNSASNDMCDFSIIDTRTDEEKQWLGTPTVKRTELSAIASLWSKLKSWFQKSLIY